MKVLVVSCGTGGGHNAAAHAVCEECLRRGHDATFLELYDLRSHRLTHGSSHVYVWSVRHKAVFKGLYHLGDSVSRHLSVMSPVYHFNAISSDKLGEYIDAGGFDAVVTSHLFAAEALTALRIHGGLSGVPLVGVETDYTCIPFWSETRLDRYLIPHPDCMDDFVAHGLPSEKLAPLGIPVSARFADPGLTSTQARKQLYASCRFQDIDAPLFVVMSGSMGFGRLEDLIATLVTLGKANILAGCGSNTTAYKRLQLLYADEPRVEVRGYLEHEELYMRAANVFLTKPGGLTSTEAAVMGVPLVHTSPIPGCEEANVGFFREHGLSFTGASVREQAQAAYELAASPEACSTMVQAQKATISPHAAADLCDLLSEMVG